MLHFNLHFADYGIISLYLLFVVGVGWLVKRQIKSSNDYLMSSHSIPLWITSLAFISANLGAQEVIGLSCMRISIPLLLLALAVATGAGAAPAATPPLVTYKTGGGLLRADPDPGARARPQDGRAAAA